MPINSLPPFKLERFFAKYEFHVKHLVCCSDSEPLKLSELLQHADAAPLERWNSLSLGYTESMGLPELREEILKLHYASNFSPKLTPANILLAAPQEAIFLTMQSLISPGDRIVCMHPAYQSLYQVAISLGATVDMWRPRIDVNRQNCCSTFHLDDLAALVEHQNVKLVVVNVPHNPTGWMPTQAEWIRIRDICQTSTFLSDGGSSSGGAYLFADEMYRGLELDAEDKLELSGVEFMPVGRGISLGGLSKSVGLPGLRLGWLVSTDIELIQCAAALKDYTTICAAAPSEILGLMAIRAWDTLVARQMEVIRCNLELLEEYAVGKWKGIMQWRAPRAGTVAYPFFKLPQGMSVDTFCTTLAEKYGVLLMPGTVYDDPDAEQVEQGLGRVRIGYGRRNLPEALEAMDAAMSELFMVE